jgi:hypothetical protein
MPFAFARAEGVSTIVAVDLVLADQAALARIC